jgi:hypothetical protein
MHPSSLSQPCIIILLLTTTQPSYSIIISPNDTTTTTNQTLTPTTTTTTRPTAVAYQLPPETPYPWQIQFVNTTIGCNPANTSTLLQLQENPIGDIVTKLIPDLMNQSTITCLNWKNLTISNMFPLVRSTASFITINCILNFFQTFANVQDCISNRNPIQSGALGFYTSTVKTNFGNFTTYDATCEQQLFFNHAIMRCILPMRYARMECNGNCSIPPPIDQSYKKISYRQRFIGISSECIPYMFENTREKVWLLLPQGAERYGEDSGAIFSSYQRIPSNRGKILVYPYNRSWCIGQPVDAIDIKSNQYIYDDDPYYNVFWPETDCSRMFAPVNDVVLINDLYINPNSTGVGRWRNYQCPPINRCSYNNGQYNTGGIIWSDKVAYYCYGEVPYQAFSFLLVLSFTLCVGSLLGCYFRERCCVCNKQQQQQQNASVIEMTNADIIHVVRPAGIVIQTQPIPTVITPQQTSGGAFAGVVMQTQPIPTVVLPPQQNSGISTTSNNNNNQNNTNEIVLV